MKKILLASSALVLVGGAAFAEVTLTGSAEMGVYGGSAKGTRSVESTTTTLSGAIDQNDPNNTNVIITETETTTTVQEDFDRDIDLQFWSDMDVDINLSGATDGGVEFGANIDLDDVADGSGINATDDSDFAVFVSGDFGTVTLGDTDGAFDWAMQDTNFGLAGTLNDAEEHLGFDGMNLLDGFYDGQIVRYDYSFGDFAFGASAELDDDSSSDSDEHDDPMLGIGAKYSMDLGTGSINLGAAYQGNDEDNYIAGLTVAGTFGGVSASVAYYAGEVVGLELGSNDDGTNLELQTGNEVGGDSQDIEYVGATIGYTFDAITVGVNGGTYDIEGVDEAWGAGITASYDLGGGLELQAGYGYSEGKTDDGSLDIEADTYSFGVAMSF